jgi:hypothetical protein
MNLRNFRKDRDSEQTISIASLQVTIRKFVSNFVWGDVIPTWVTNPLFKIMDDLFIATFTGLLSVFVCVWPLHSIWYLPYRSQWLILGSHVPESLGSSSLLLAFLSLDQPKSVLIHGQVPRLCPCPSFLLIPVAPSPRANSSLQHQPWSMFYPTDLPATLMAADLQCPGNHFHLVCFPFPPSAFQPKFTSPPTHL